ncbi:MAG TPA: HD domain-containing phosphohydrolase [Anaerolineales bacterium]|nr:HD domain-containing phosphohydrolase [Anaerolineales bacterium]
MIEPTVSREGISEKEWQLQTVRPVLIMTAATLGLLTIPVFLGWLAGKFTFLAVTIMATMSIMVCVAWLCQAYGWLRLAKFIPLVIFFVMALYINFISGLGVAASLFYVLVVALTTVFFSPREQLVAILLCIAVPLVIASIRGGWDAAEFWARSLTYGGLLIGINLLQWWPTRQFRLALARSRAYALDLQREIWQREQFQAELRYERDLMRDIMTTSPIGILLIDREGRISYANAQSERTLGAPMNEIIQRSFNDPAWGAVKMNGEAMRLEDYPFYQVKTSGKPVVDYRHILRFGTDAPIYLSINASPLYDGDGSFDGVVASVQDITETERAHQALRLSEEKFRNIIEALPLGVYLYDLQPDGRLQLTGSNPSADRILGFEQAEFLGQDMETIFPNLIETEIPAAYKKVAEEGVVWYSDLVNYEDDRVTGAYEVHAFQTAPGKTAVIFQDITERLQTQKRQSRLAAIIEASPDLVATVKPDGSLLYLNRAGRALLGIGSDDDITNYSYRDFYDAEDVQFIDREVVPQVIANGVWVGENEYVTRQAYHLPVSQVMIAHYDGDGAVEYISTVARDIRERLQHEWAMQEAYDTTLEGWARALELRDKETEGHSRNVTNLAVKLAECLGLKEEELIHIRRGALLHDIGKMGIPDHILLKKGPLETEEWGALRQHPVYAYELLKQIPFLQPALVIPYCHHERWDGTGYPRGLKGAEIPLAARIFAVVDVWDALTSERPYRAAWSEADTLEYLRAQAGRHFDPQVVRSFLALIAPVS